MCPAGDSGGAKLPQLSQTQSQSWSGSIYKSINSNRTIININKQKPVAKQWDKQFCQNNGYVYVGCTCNLAGNNCIGFSVEAAVTDNSATFVISMITGIFMLE